MHKAYYRFSKQFHPDRHFDFPELDIKGKLIKIVAYATEANNILSDPEKREGYDQDISVAQTTDHVSHNDQGNGTQQLIDDKIAKEVINDFHGESEQGPREDAGTHYDLATAYIEMGLVDDAVNEFRIAAKDPSKRAMCSRMIAGCYADNGNYQLAIEELNQLMSELSEDSSEYLEITYDLAEMYVKNSEYDNALKLYNEIQSHDAGYRDVAGRIETVSSLI